MAAESNASEPQQTSTANLTNGSSSDIAPTGEEGVMDTSLSENIETTSSDVVESPQEVITSEEVTEGVGDDIEDGLLSEQSQLSSTEEGGAGQVGELAPVFTNTPSLFDGAFNYSYPIKVPPGRNGLQPKLELNYNSNGRAEDSIFGRGWSISVPYIERINKTGVSAMLTGYDFYSSLSGELERIGTTTSYRSKIEDGNFFSYEFVGNVWTVKDKVGKVYTFGSTTASRQDNAASSTQIFKWMVNEIRDTNDNYIAFSYYKAQNQIYPDVITYTGNGTTDGIFTIEFTRSSVSYNPVQYDTGFAATTTYRISEIRTEVDGHWVRKYSLTYGDADNAHREVLTEITETGQEDDSSVTLSLPSAQFSYQTTMDTGWSANDTSWSLPEGIVETGNGRDVGTRFADINGDGYLDILRYFQNPHATSGTITIKKLYLHNTVNGWALNTSFDWSAAPLPFTKYKNFGDSNPRNDLGSRILDINGDGLADLVVGHYNDNSTDLKAVYINTGEEWVEDENWILPEYITYFNNEVYALDAGVRFGDVNGDGLPDLIISRINSSGNLFGEVYINTGSNWVLDDSWDTPEPFTNCYTCTGKGDDLGTYLVDINGDGLVDFVRGYFLDAAVDVDVQKVYLNTGRGWTRAPWTGIPHFVHRSFSPSDRGIRFGDVNGDGLVDLVQATSVGDPDVEDLYINTGSGWTGTIGVEPTNHIRFTNSSGDGGYRLLDIDSDGLDDLIYAATQDKDVSGGNIEEYVFKNSRKVADTLINVTTPEGGEIGVSYKASTKYRNAGQMGNPDLPYILHTVATTTFDSQHGNSWDNTYQYLGGDHYFATSSIPDRKFSGFEQIIQSTPLKQQTNYYHQGNGDATSTEEQGDDYAKIGFLYRTDISDNTTDLYQSKHIDWGGFALGDESTYVTRDAVITMDYDGDNDHRDSAVSWSYNYTNGNISSTKEWGEVIASSSGSFSDIGSDLRETRYTYATNTTKHILALPATVTTLASSSIKVQESRYYYDMEVLGDVEKGNITKEENWATTTEYLTRKWTYDSYGLPLTEVDPRGSTTTYSYDENLLFIATSTNAEAHSLSYLHDYSSGAQTRQIDGNGQVLETVYDALDRKKFEYIPDPDSGSPVVKTFFDYIDTRNNLKIKREDRLSSTLEASTHLYKDGFGRLLQERQKDDDLSNYIVRDYQYDGEGLLSKESLPYLSGGLTRTTPTVDTDLYSYYTYDPLQRVTEVTTAVGSTVTEYDQWQESITDTEGGAKEYLYDAYKRLTEVSENNGTSTYVTSYDWDHNNNLIKIEDAMGNVRHLTYDALSRRLSLEDLHNASDTSFGVWQFTYDPNGNLISYTDPKGQIINQAFDGINRILSQNYVANHGVETVYMYDSCDEGVGRVCEIRHLGATTSLEYNLNGGVAAESREIDGDEYIAEYTYDRQGNRILTINPDGSEIKNTFNLRNKIEKIEYSEDGSSFVEVISDINYGPNNQPVQIAHSNGILVTNTYNPDELYRLQQKTITQIEEQDGYRIPVTIDSTYVDSTLSDFPVYINLADLPSEFWNDVSVNGGDIRVKDPSGQEMPVEVVSINTSAETGELYFKADTVSASTGSTFYIYYGDGISTMPSATSTYGRNNVWSDYAAVYHFQGNIDSAKTINSEGTANLNLSVNNAPTTTLGFDGQTNGAYDFDGNADRLILNNPSGGNFYGTEGTLSMWVNADSVSNTYQYIYDDLDPSPDRNMELLVRNNAWYRYDRKGTVSVVANSAYGVSVVGDWQHVAANYKNGYPTNLYINSTLEASAGGNWVGPDNSSPSTAHIGGYVYGGTTYTNRGWNGKIDEFRISLIERSADWIESEHMNMSSSSVFYNVGEIEEVTDLQTPLLAIDYEYDNVGNILQITEFNGATTTRLYTYDDLYRLTKATSTIGTSTAYVQSYVYDPLGNLLSKTGQGAYTYNGHQSINYANPHAATAIGGVTYSYDRNGNLASTSAGFGATWDYLNRLTASVDGATSLTYSYDQAGARVLKDNGTSITKYPFNFYEEEDGATTTKNIYVDDMLLATAEQIGSTTQIYHNHLDHLGSPVIVSDESAQVIQELAYYPFGDVLLNETETSFDQSRKYIGQEYDEESEMSYLKARYLKNDRGQFISQDPVFWEIGQTKDGIAVLKNPQAQNSYSYAQNNPIVLKDPDGRIAFGFGFNGSGSLPGMYADASTYAVLTMSASPLNIEVGLISSGGGGLTTGLASLDGSAGVLLSNARSISDLEGPDAVLGGSVKIGGTFGVDVGMSKNSANRQIVTVNPTVGLGGVATPYVIPAELHGGAGYSKSFGQMNITNSLMNGASSVKSSVQTQLSNIANQLRQIQKAVSELKAKNQKKN